MTTDHATYTRTEDGGVVIENPYADARFQLAQLRSALRIEIRTGMRMSQGSVLSFLQTHSVEPVDENGFAEPITRKRTKRGAYADLDAVCVRAGLDPKPLPKEGK